jgi:hypothetical protein
MSPASEVKTHSTWGQFGDDLYETDIGSCSKAYHETEGEEIRMQTHDDRVRKTRSQEQANMIQAREQPSQK